MKLISRTRVMFALSIAIAIGAAWAAHALLARQAEIVAQQGKVRTVMVVVPKRDMPKGAQVGDGDVQKRSVPADSVHANALRPVQFPEYRGRALTFSARAGEPLLADFFEAPRPPAMTDRLAAGRRAITIPVDETSSIANMLRPGDHIDLVSMIKLESRSYLTPLLLDVPVLATGGNASEASARDGRKGFTTVTLDVTAADAERIMAARELGKLAALLRGTGDRGEVSASRKEALALLGLVEPRPTTVVTTPRAQPGITILYGIAAPGAAARPVNAMASLAALGKPM